MADTILVVVEQREGKLNRVSLETLTGAQSLAAETGWTLEAAVAGSGVGDIANEIAKYKVAKVYDIESAKLEPYTPDGFVAALKQFIEQKQPKLVLMPHTYQVRDFAPKLAATLNRSLISDAIGYKYEGGKLLFTRQMFQGKFAADVSFVGEAPYFATFQNGAFRGDQVQQGDAAAPVETVNVEVADGVVRNKPEAPFKEAKQAVDLDAGRDHRRRRPRHQGAEEHRDREATGGRAGRRDRSVAPHLRFRLAAHGSPGRIVGTNGCAQALSGARHQRRNPARRRHERRAYHHRHQQRFGSADL